MQCFGLSQTKKKKGKNQNNHAKSINEENKTNKRRIESQYHFF